jgi:hypothetical protein
MTYTRTMPDGWTMLDGDWGVDAQREEIVTQSGGSSLRLGGSDVTVTFLSDPVPLDLNTEYEMYAIVRADSVASGAHLDVQLLLYDENVNAESQEINLKVPGTPLSEANKWIFIGATLDRDTAAKKNARWARFLIQKYAYDFNVYIDRIELRRNPPSRALEALSVGYRLPIGTQNTVFFDLPSDYADSREIEIVKHASLNRATALRCRVPGWYSAELKIAIGAPYPSNTFYYRLGIGKNPDGALYATSYSAIYALDQQDVGGAFLADGADIVTATHSTVMRMSTDDVFYAFVAAQDIFQTTPTIDGQPAIAFFKVAMLT